MKVFHDCYLSAISGNIEMLAKENKSNFLKIKNKPSELNTSLGIKIGEGITSREV